MTILVRSGVGLPVVASEKKGKYPFDDLKAPRPVFMLEVATDAKGKPKTDAEGNPIFAKNEDGTNKVALDENGMPIPQRDANGNAVFDYDYFAVPGGKTAKKMTSTLYSAVQRYATDIKTTVDEKTGKKKNTYTKTRDFEAYDLDPAQYGGDTLRIYRIL